MDSAVDNQVAELIRKVALEEILPRFRKLGAGDVRTKSEGELVTGADIAAQRRLVDGLRELLPDSAFIAEESGLSQLEIARALERDHVWAIDPLDGTAHFASGDGPFGIIVALIERGVTERAWIHLPLDNCTATARRGAGATLDGAPVVLEPEPERPRGVVLDRFFPDELRAAVSRGFADLELGAPARCGAKHYVDLLRGESDFALYHRTLIWDHAAGVLIAEEAGGRARRLDGTSYVPGSSEAGLLVASSRRLWQQLRARIV